LYAILLASRGAQRREATKPYAKIDKPRKPTSPLSTVPLRPKFGSESNISSRPASEPSLTNTPSALKDNETSDDSSNDEDRVPAKKTTARTTSQSVEGKENRTPLNKKAATETTDLSIEDTDRLKTKFIKITNRYFIHKRNPSDRNVRRIVKEEFHLDPNIGAGYVIYKSGMRAFNNMRYELYKNTENVADAFILKYTKYIVSNAISKCGF